MRRFPWELLLWVVVAGCSSTPRRVEPPPLEPASKPAAPASKPATPATKGGNYYLDDGPGANPPANLVAVPDAVPRVETLHRGAMRPYTVMGRNYTPMTALAPYKARGIASWYGRRYHGKQTSSGEIYDMYAMTAAHTTLPLPSYVRVTNLANGRTVVVRVNDRGPFIDSRLIDLSYTAAYKLGTLAGGSAMVEVELIMPGAAPPAAPQVSAAPKPTAPTTVAPEPPPQIAVATTAGSSYLQLAAFSSRENADAYVNRLASELAWLAPQLQVYISEGLFRVHAGPFASAAEAREAAGRMAQALGIKPLVISR